MLSSTWYCKPTDTRLILNFHAMVTKRYKCSVIQGFVYRIYRACSSWKKFHESLIKPKDILEWNQYPPNFYEPIISATIEKNVKTCNEKVNCDDANNENSPAKVNSIMQYQCLPTDNFIKQLKRSNAPIQPVVTLRKQKTFLPSLKPNVKEEFSRHMITHFKEQSNQKKQTCQKAFWYMCWSQITKFWRTNISIIKPRSRAPLDRWSIIY